MNTAAEYRKYAQECKDGARLATSDAARMQFLELAKLWLPAATQIELRENGKIVLPQNNGASLEPME